MNNGSFSYDKQGPNIRFSITVNDIWTRQVYFYEDYAPNEWNSPRDAAGKIIGQMNTNHVPLLTKMKGKENDGYCFENDFVWALNKTKTPAETNRRRSFVNVPQGAALII